MQEKTLDNTARQGFNTQKYAAGAAICCRETGISNGAANSPAGAAISNRRRLG
jgi:hypothetical protein